MRQSCRKNAKGSQDAPPSGTTADPSMPLLSIVCSAHDATHYEGLCKSLPASEFAVRLLPVTGLAELTAHNSISLLRSSRIIMYLPALGLGEPVAQGRTHVRPSRFPLGRHLRHRVSFRYGRQLGLLTASRLRGANALWAASP